MNANGANDHASDFLPSSSPIVRIDPMQIDDIARVSAVERRCFSNPWPASAYRRELQHTEQNYYIVLRREAPEPAGAELDWNGDQNGRALARRTLFPLGFGRRRIPADQPVPIAGFAGMWNAFDEAHVTTIAVDEPYRGLGLGELLLAALFDEAARRNAVWMTLEVRVSNAPAKALYEKWGFDVQGVRKRYYSDNNEDADIMWSRALTDPGYQAQLSALRARAINRLQGRVAGMSKEPIWPTQQTDHGPAPWETGR